MINFVNLLFEGELTANTESGDQNFPLSAGSNLCARSTRGRRQKVAGAV